MYKYCNCRRITNERNEEENAKSLSNNHSIVEQKKQRQGVLEDIAEETPLIKAPRKIDVEDEKKNGKKANIFSNILRPKK